MGRLLAVCGWLAWQVERRVEGTALRRFGAPRVALGVAALLAIAGAVPIMVAALDPQPQDVTVEAIRAGGVTHAEGWVRLRGRVVPLEESPTGEPGNWALLVDAANPLRAIAIRSAEALRASTSTTLTGHIALSAATVTEELPIEATVAGTPPVVVPDRVVRLDAAPRPERVLLWPLVAVPWILGAALAIGALSGYPVFRTSREVDVLAAPMAPGDRVPAAVAGRLGQHRLPLGAPAEALILVGRGPRGGVLTVQLLAQANRPAPPPIQVGGGWTSGRVGYVYTVSETVPALAVRSERADAILLFANIAERDRVAALIALDR